MPLHILIGRCQEKTRRHYNIFIVVYRREVTVLKKIFEVVNVIFTEREYLPGCPGLDRFLDVKDREDCIVISYIVKKHTRMNSFITNIRVNMIDYSCTTIRNTGRFGNRSSKQILFGILNISVRPITLKEKEGLEMVDINSLSKSQWAIRLRQFRDITDITFCGKLRVRCLISRGE